MADIFISYSRKDSEQALSLAEQLRSLGMVVWIDSEGIGGATLWSQEIVASIAACGTFVLLISRSSILSSNVLRELLLAMEKGKSILPVMIDEVELPQTFEYPLAGVQRVSITDWEGIISVLKNPQSAGPHHWIIPKKKVAKSPPTMFKQMRYPLIGVMILVVIYSLFIKQKNTTGGSHTIAVLPFENATGDSSQNYFAYGFADELTGALLKIHSLRVTSPERIHEYKTASLAPLAAGGELGVDYIVSGSVLRKDSTIKISVHVLDVHSGEIVWSESYEGQRRDIFRIQEDVPKQIASALRLALTPSEDKQLETHGTTNADAQDYYLRGIQHFGDPTEESVKAGISLCREAIRLDPHYANAYAGVARFFYNIALNTKDSTVRIQSLDTGYQNAVKAITFDPASSMAYEALALIYASRRQFEDALGIARKVVALEPNDGRSYYLLSCVYSLCDTLPEESVRNLEKSILLDSSLLWNHVTLYEEYKKIPGHEPDVRRTALRAIPVFSYYLSKNPEALLPRAWLRTFFLCVGQDSNAKRELLVISKSPQLNPWEYVELSEELLKVGEDNRGIELLKRGLGGPSGAEIRRILKTTPATGIPYLVHLPFVQTVIRHK